MLVIWVVATEKLCYTHTHTHTHRHTHKKNYPASHKSPDVYRLPSQGRNTFVHRLREKDFWFDFDFGEAFM